MGDSRWADTAVSEMISREIEFPSQTSKAFSTETGAIPLTTEPFPMKSLYRFLLMLVAVGIFQMSQSEDDLSQLEALAGKFLESFNEKDAVALSELFLPNGELVLASGDLIAGRDAIREHYEKVFAKPESPKAALEAGSVRFPTGRLAVEDGTIHFNFTDGEITSHFYTAVHSKGDDGTWSLASVRDESGDHALPSEKLLALEWLVGDWVIQTGSSDTWISFSWSEDGPYIDAKAVTETPAGPSTAATMRIGWNEREESFHSWGFDAGGGFTQSAWTEKADGQWLLRTEGVTAAGEKNVATQVITRKGTGESFGWAKRDQIIGGIVQPDQDLEVLQRPPQPVATTDQTE